MIAHCCWFYPCLFQMVLAVFQTLLLLLLLTYASAHRYDRNLIKSLTNKHGLLQLYKPEITIESQKNSYRYFDIEERRSTKNMIQKEK